ncbi:hypothetical protein HYS31_00570 [Candidatus Woesearchaeota archaeon]|nr:hypothetical protein [Candidatus Woesearchaeota archaeon]
MADIVMPDNNEEEFMQMAQRLGIKKLCFLYNPERLKASKGSNVLIERCILINRKSMNLASSRQLPLVAKDDGMARFFIETGKVKMVYGFEESQKKDYLSQKASGLNHIVCELARRNNVIIGFSYSSLFGKDRQSTVLIGRMIQNIRLCQKYKVKTLIGCFSSNPYDLRPGHDLSSLFSTLGMDKRKIIESRNFRL